MGAANILIADDEPSIADFVRSVALDCGYLAEAVSHVDALQERLADPQLTHIFLDLNMPGLDGIEVLRFLAKIRCQARIVIFSGADTKIRDAARRLGAEMGLDMAAVLGKPLRLADLRNTLHDLMPATVEPTVATLKAAIAAEELFLEYQPRVSLAGGALAGVEALVRWRQPNGHVVMPGEFLPVIEGTDAINSLTWSVIDQALDQLSCWLADDVHCPVSINLSPHILTDLAFVDRLAAMCAHRDIAPDLVTLELTETAAVRDQLATIDILTRLRLKGFGLAIDDFGTGYSAIAQLHRLPFNELKIDRSFVSELGTSEDARVIVRAMVDLAHNLSLRVCAEGVEDEAALAILNELGCDMAQGFHIGRPMVAAAIPKWAARKREPILRAVPVEPSEQWAETIG